MTKVLYLVRHAQASEGATSDIYRPLTSNGLIDISRVSKHLAPKMEGVQKIISSHSERTRMTAEIIAEQLNLSKDCIEFDETLYESAPRNYLQLLNNLPENLDSVMIIGHNPSLSYLAEYLCDHEFGSIPTSGIVGLKFENQTWAEISKRTGEQLFYDSPDSLLGVKLD